MKSRAAAPAPQAISEGSNTLNDPDYFGGVNGDLALHLVSRVH
jgi:hypothetical protein